MLKKSLVAFNCWGIGNINGGSFAFAPEKEARNTSVVKIRNRCLFMSKQFGWYHHYEPEIYKL
jgi:hypothetical protein